MQIIDSHCHLDLIEERGFNIDAIVGSAMNSNIAYIQSISVLPSKFEKIYSYTQNYTNVFCSIGMHPLYCTEEAFDYELCDKICSLPKVNSIGECGLDYSKNPATEEKQLQQKVFLQQIDLSDKHNIPLIIHTRDAEEKTYELLEQACKTRKNIKGVMHCFTGSRELALAMLDLGFYISFSGIITFKKKVSHLQDLVKEIPIERILVETDAPYLSPEPFRGKQNTPEMTKYVAEKVAELKNMSLEDIAKQTTKNYFDLFHSK